MQICFTNGFAVIGTKLAELCNLYFHNKIGKFLIDLKCLFLANPNLPNEKCHMKHENTTIIAAHNGRTLCNIKPMKNHINMMSNIRLDRLWHCLYNKCDVL